MRLSLVNLSGELLVVDENTAVVENVQEVRLHWPEGRLEATAMIGLDYDGTQDDKTREMLAVNVADFLGTDEEVHEHPTVQKLAPEFQGTSGEPLPRCGQGFPLEPWAGSE